MNVVGPIATDGPLFVAVRATAPEVPGVRAGEETASRTSAERAPAVTDDGATLLAVDGSVVVVDAAAVPPASVPGAWAAASETGIETVVDAPLARLPLTVQVTVPEDDVQPDGNVPPEAGTVTPDGGVYTNVVGPTASDGPPFVAVKVTVPDVPGVIVGVVTAIATSALRAPAVTVVGLTVLFADDGSAVPVVIEAEPPVSAPGAEPEAIATGIVTVLDAPLAMPDETTHVTVPDDSVQPLGNVPSVTPVGGEYVKVSGVAASDGPLFVAVSTTVPEVPGVIVGDETVRATSAFGVPTTTEVGLTVVFADDGSVVVVLAEAEPPVRVPGDVAGGIETGMVTDVAAPAETLPATVQVTVPLASVHPLGSVPSVTPAGGV